MSSRGSIAFAVMAVVAGCRTLGAEPADRSAWQPVAQPHLLAELTNAPEARFEHLADGPDTCWKGPAWWCPNPDGKSADLVLFYYPEYMGPHEVFVFDFGTGELKKTEIREREGQRFMFHLVPTFTIGNRLYVKPNSSGDAPLWIYDAASNTFAFGGFPMDGQVGSGGGWTLGDDGQLYGVGMKQGTRNIVFYRIDPATRRGAVFPPVEPAKANVAWIYSSIVADGDWLYATVGNTPWQLFAYNVKTGDGKVLAESERVVGDHKTMALKRLPSRVGCQVSFTDMKGHRGETRSFWLRDGQLTPKSGETPPWGTERNAVPPAGTRQQEGDHKPPAGIEVCRTPIAADGTVRVWYRLKGDALAAAAGWASDQVRAGKWGKFEFKVRFYPTEIRRMATLCDGRILALAEGYGRAMIYDPAKNLRQILGPTMSVYSLTAHGTNVYMCGYPGSRLWRFDPSRPWTAGSAAGDAAEPPFAADGAEQTDEARATKTTNPSEVAVLKEQTHVHMPFGGILVGADGRVYIGGKIIRIGNGGGLGWWDPKTGATGGIVDDFSAYQVFWMCTAADARYILCSTKPVTDDKDPDYTPAVGRLFVYDTQRQTIIHKIDSEAWTVPGYIAEAKPGLVMGYATAKDGTTGLLYGLDAAAGQILWTKPVPFKPVTGFSAVRRAGYCYVKGTDGMLWTTMDGTLVRIDPADVRVHAFCKTGDNQICFAGGSIYVAGAEKLRRLAGRITDADR